MCIDFNLDLDEPIIEDNYIPPPLNIVPQGPLFHEGQLTRNRIVHTYF